MDGVDGNSHVDFRKIPMPCGLHFWVVIWVNMLHQLNAKYMCVMIYIVAALRHLTPDAPPTLLPSPRRLLLDSAGVENDVCFHGPFPYKLFRAARSCSE